MIRKKNKNLRDIEEVIKNKILSNKAHYINISSKLESQIYELMIKATNKQIRDIFDKQ